MIKKIFFQSIFFNFFFLREVFAAESGGMPQLNPEFWVSQIFWLIITFGILYIVLSKFILPKISSNLELRKSQIQENIETAEKQREMSEVKLKEYDEILKNCKKRNGSFIYASNFSVGVNLFFNLNEYFAQLMEPWKDYTPSIEEIHHTKKLDKPSGTAITLTESILPYTQKEDWKLVEEDEKASANQIPVVAKREEDVKGTHSIKYSSAIDDIEIKHTAHSREGFALGAVIAAEWLSDKTGVFTMKDVLGL